MSEPALSAASSAQCPIAHSPRPLRVALLGYRSNPYSGGQGVYLKFLARALREAGHTVDVISGEPYPELDDGIGLIKLPGLNLFASANHLTALRPGHLRSWADFFEWLSMATGGFPEPYTFGRRVVAHLRSCGQRYDIVHDNQCLSYGTLSLQTRMPLLTTIHHPITWDRDIALSHARTWKERLLIRRWHHFLAMQGQVARKLKHIVTVSERSKQDICRAFNIDPARIQVIYNGIDTESFHPEPDITRNHWQLITTASADQPLKGTQHLIPAFAMLCERYPQLKLVFIGKPKPGGTTEQLIDLHGVRERIRFAHGISVDEIRHLYASSSIAVVPSEYEGFGFPAGEAMACGLPVVSTNGGALPEVVGDAAPMVPVGDSNALAREVARLLDNDSEWHRYARLGRDRILEKFSWQRAASTMTTLYGQIVAGKDA